MLDTLGSAANVVRALGRGRQAAAGRAVTVRATLWVWNRILCEWVRWHGSRVAWNRLPHAVAVGGCIVGAALALRAPASIAPAYRVPPPVLARHVPATRVPEPSGAALLAGAVVAISIVRARRR